MRRPDPLPVFHIPRLICRIPPLRRRAGGMIDRAAAGRVALFDVLNARGVEGVRERGVVEECVAAY